jgi:hypothetical protein
MFLFFYLSAETATVTEIKRAGGQLEFVGTAADAAIVETSQSSRRWKEDSEKHGQASPGTCSRRSNLYIIDLKM